MTAVRGWWQRRTLRARLTMVTAALIALALTGASVVLVGALRHSLRGSIDDTARTTAHAIAAAEDAGRLTPPLAPDRESDVVDQVVAPDGHVVASTKSVADQGRLFFFRPGPRVSVRSMGQLDFLGTADSYRVAAIRTADGSAVYSAEPSDDMDETVDRLIGRLFIGVPLVWAILVAIAYVVIRRALDSASRRQREFIADAAHELRSPLAALRTHLEVGPEASDTRASADTATALAEIDRMHHLVDDLLHLARLDEHRPPVRRAVDLDDIVFSEVARARPSARVPIDVRGVTAAKVDGDPAALTHLVRNLIDNAVRHASSRVTVSLSFDGDHGEPVVLAVADDGPGIPVADRSRVFDRFVRLDEGRGRDAGGVGLGLAIVRSVADAHGGSAVVADGGGGATFVVRLPSSR
jgi:signal transduction histidine kinase